MKSLLLSFVFIISSTYAQDIQNKKLFQIMPITALMQGIYDGSYSYKELKTKGDFGLGTFEGIDGEMVALDGMFYQMYADGTLKLVDNNQTTPFAQVCFFEQAKSIDISNVKSFVELEKIIAQKIPNKNLPYAIKLTGSFKYLKLRAIHKQNKPYRPLATVAKEQIIFDMKDKNGTLVGFWMPQYFSTISVAGLHLHFIDKNKLHGGHVLNLEISKSELQFNELNDFEMLFSNTKELRNAILHTNEDDITAVERSLK